MGCNPCGEDGGCGGAAVVALVCECVGEAYGGETMVLFSGRRIVWVEWALGERRDGDGIANCVASAAA